MFQADKTFGFFDQMAGIKLIPACQLVSLGFWIYISFEVSTIKPYGFFSLFNLPIRYALICLQRLQKFCQRYRDIRLCLRIAEGKEFPGPVCIERNIESMNGVRPVY
jgi:hypothetical protein